MAIGRIHASIALTVVGASLVLTACGTAPARTSAPTASVSMSSHRPASAGPAATGCGPQPPRYAWAVDVTTAGRVVWKTPLPTRNGGFSTVAQPLVAGPVAVLAQDGIVHGLDLGDGHPLWSWTGGQDVFGMWRWGGLVAVLTDQVSSHSRLTGLAMITTAGVLQVVNLADGRIRWRRTAGASPALTAAGQLVIFSINGRLTGYDDRTGQPRWTTGGLPGQPTIQVAGSLVLVTSNAQGPGITTALTAVLPASGRIAWRFDTGEPLTVLSAGPAGLTVAAYVFNRRLYLLDLRTGRPRWQADTFVTEGTTPLVTGTDVLAVEGQPPSTRLVDRNAADGRVRWQDTLAASPGGQQQVLQAGPLAVLQTNPSFPGSPAPLLAYQLSSGRSAWQVDMPTFVSASPVLAPGHLLVQPADLVSTCAVVG
jgi:outer membrane protein assembly factor BamB